MRRQGQQASRAYNLQKISVRLCPVPQAALARELCFCQRAKGQSCTICDRAAACCWGAPMTGLSNPRMREDGAFADSDAACRHPWVSQNAAEFKKKDQAYNEDNGHYDEAQRTAWAGAASDGAEVLCGRAGALSGAGLVRSST